MAEFFCIESNHAARRYVLRLSGELTQEGEASLAEAIQNAVQSSSEQVVFDFSGVRYINSAGISVLHNLISRFRYETGKILFTGLTRHLRRVLEIVGFDEYVEFVEIADHAE
jgi:anti-anti-sigma factor